MNHAAVTFACVGINIFFIVLAYMGRSLGPTYLLLIILAIAFSGLGLLYYRRPRRHLVVAKGMHGQTELKAASKVVPLTPEASVADKN
jgi:hypothetical protein